MARKTSTDTFDMAASNAAALDERKRMNAALAAGAVVYVKTCAYRLVSVTNDWWYITAPVDGGSERSWAGCNDGDWRDMMRQAGLERNPRWR